jgi:hypothetical protein
VVLEAAAAVAGDGHTHGNPTLYAIEVRLVKDTLVAVAAEAASLFVSALFSAAKVRGDVDALFLEDPFRFGQTYGYCPSPTLGRQSVIM